MMEDDTMECEDSYYEDLAEVPQLDVIHQDHETKENWLIYTAGETAGNFDDWLERHAPSRLHKHRFDLTFTSYFITVYRFIV